jgi:hypothetical protein
MATKRLEGWTLTCGVWPPFPLPSLTDIESALREQGILKRECTGMDALYDRWVDARSWTYAVEFDCPDEDERALLRFEMLSGKGSVRLNGRALAEFKSGELTVDITGGVQPEKNRLEVTFYPGVRGGSGILGPVWLRTTNYVELKRVRAAASEGVVKVASDLVAHTAGRFLFKYQVSLDGEMALASEVYERLRAAEARVEHVLKLPSPVKWDGEQYYTVRLSVERSGVACDSVLLNAAMDPPQPRRAVGAPEWRNRDLIRALRALGAEAVNIPFATRENALVPFDLLSDGLLLTDEAGWLNEYSCDDLMALPEPRTLAKLAGGEKYWPPGTPVWRATGSFCPEQRTAEALYGANALGDAARYARLSRFAQAEAVRALALNARREGKAFAVWAAEEDPTLSSIAVIEHSGKARPAYGALKQAWGACAAFEFAKPFEASLPLKVWLYPKAAMRRPATVTASLYRLDGSLIASTSFAAMPGEPSLVGELRATLPEEGVVIARAELTDGDVTTRIDQAVCLTKPGEPMRGALLNPPRAELRLVSGELSCAGQTAALGVFAGVFYGALLPGEKIALPGGIAPEDIESLNGLIL